MSITYEFLKNDAQVKAYIEMSNETLKELGLTEHSFPHVCHTAEIAAMILTELDYDEKSIELAKIASLMHDIGNMVNRKLHAASGAEITRCILEKHGMTYRDIGIVCSAIGNHDEGTAGKPANAVSAALILADKTDVRRSRVQETCMEEILADIHDRVNYAVTRADVVVIKHDPQHGETSSKNRPAIRLCLDIDIEFTPVSDYFEIFLSRMIMCRRSAEYLGCDFQLFINDSKIM